MRVGVGIFGEGVIFDGFKTDLVTEVEEVFNVGTLETEGVILGDGVSFGTGESVGILVGVFITTPPILWATTVQVCSVFFDCPTPQLLIGETTQRYVCPAIIVKGT